LIGFQTNLQVDQNGGVDGENLTTVATLNTTSAVGIIFNADGVDSFMLF